MADYKLERVNLNDILLDAENPRFASYFERKGKDSRQATQEDIIDYLKDYESIDILSKRIKEAKGLHPTELIACIKYNGKYIVLEGNRRICACKELYGMYCSNIDETEFIKNIVSLMVVVYKNRIIAQPYISDKHIDGVKKWDSIEKSCYYFRMFHEKKRIDSTIPADKIVDVVSKETISKKADVKESIVKYGFYMSVYEALIISDYSRDALKDVTSFLPLVDRFMRILVGDNKEVGLSLPLNELNYVAHNGKEHLLKEILKLVGEAFLVRETGNPYSDSAMYRINSKEVDKQTQQIKLITENKRIPGLLGVIKKYKGVSEPNVAPSEKPKSKNKPEDTPKPTGAPMEERKEKTSTGFNLKNRKVFVVHGRNNKIRDSMFTFLRAIGLEPIEWGEAKNLVNSGSPYINEILHAAFAKAHATIVLFTPDDEARLKKEFICPNDEEYEKNLTPQARPNVLFEAGMAMGYYPTKTIFVKFGTLRPFSDISGMNFIRMSNDAKKRKALIDTLKTIGLEVNIDNKDDWLSSGDFDLSDT
jgi:predicted nucleotide-binding protein